MKAFPFSNHNGPYFIAEIGSNHNQDEERLTNLIESARRVGFDAIKLQYYKADKLWSPEFPERIEAAKRGEIEKIPLLKIKQLCNSNHIAFGCSVFNKCDVEYVFPFVDFLKISSYECLRDDLIQKCKETNLPVFVSTGMCNRDEIISIFCNDILHKEDVMFHCISSYPANIDDMRIDILQWMKNNFGRNLNIGYSDHTCEETAVLCSIAAGANIIEMHVDLDDMQGNESKYGHCWRFYDSRILIEKAEKMFMGGDLFSFSDRKSKCHPIGFHLSSSKPDVFMSTIIWVPAGMNSSPICKSRVVMHSISQVPFASSVKTVSPTLTILSPSSFIILGKRLDCSIIFLYGARGSPFWVVSITGMCPNLVFAPVERNSKNCPSF